MNFTKSDEDYQSKIIGEFFVYFDMAISVIPFGIPKIIYKRNYTELEKRNIQTLLSGMVASSLKISFDSLLADNYKELPELIKINDNLSKSLDKITEIRNSFAHGSYRIGWKDFDGNMDKDFFSLRHSKATKKGYEKRSGIYKISQLENLINELRIMQKSYLLIFTIITLKNQNQDFNMYMDILRETLKSIGKLDFKPLLEEK